VCSGNGFQAGKRRLLIVAVAVLFAVAAAAALAADLLVGDGKGWHLDAEYDEWVDGNEFFVGDTLGTCTITRR